MRHTNARVSLPPQHRPGPPWSSDHQANQHNHTRLASGSWQSKWARMSLTSGNSPSSLAVSEGRTQQAGCKPPERKSRDGGSVCGSRSRPPPCASKRTKKAAAALQRTPISSATTVGRQRLNLHSRRRALSFVSFRLASQCAGQQR